MAAHPTLVKIEIQTTKGKIRIKPVNQTSKANKPPLPSNLPVLPQPPKPPPTTSINDGETRAATITSNLHLTKVNTLLCRNLL
jgi:hypothetical protein